MTAFKTFFTLHIDVKYYVKTNFGLPDNDFLLKTSEKFKISGQTLITLSDEKRDLLT